MNIKTTDGARYENQDRIIKHINWMDFPRREYNREYLDKYRAIPESQLTEMGILRIQTLEDIVGRLNHKSIYELGFGTGYFLKQCAAQMMECHGYDVANDLHWVETYTPNCRIEADIFCAFDVIEHLDDLDDLFDHVLSEWVFLSVPWLPMDLSTFETWRHRRPDEHIWHFDEVSLPRFLRFYDYQLRYLGNPEDALRIGEREGQPNILTVIAKRL